MALLGKTGSFTGLNPQTTMETERQLFSHMFTFNGPWKSLASGIKGQKRGRDPSIALQQLWCAWESSPKPPASLSMFSHDSLPFVEELVLQSDFFLGERKTWLDNVHVFCTFLHREWKVPDRLRAMKSSAVLGVDFGRLDARVADVSPALDAAVRRHGLRPRATPAIASRTTKPRCETCNVFHTQWHSVNLQG